MRLLKYLIVMIGFLRHIEAKAFQTNKGTYDHMHENLYLKKLPVGYEMRYVPHVEGKPIFIPFDETTPNILKLDNKDVFVPLVKQKSIKKNNVLTSEHLKVEKEHPQVIDVVTKAVFNSDHLKDIIKPINKNPEIKKEIKIKPSEKVKEKIRTDITSKYKVTKNNYETKAGILKQPVDSPMVVESLTEYELSKAEGTVNKNEVIYIKKDSVKKLSSKLGESKIEKLNPIKLSNENNRGELPKRQYEIDPFISEDLFDPEVERPNIVETLAKKNSVKKDEMAVYEKPVVVEALVKKDSAKKDEMIYDEPVVVEALDIKSSEKKNEMIYERPVVVEALVKKPDLNKNLANIQNQVIYPTKFKEASYGHVPPDIIEAEVVKNPTKFNKRVKYSTKMKHPIKFKDTSQNKLRHDVENKPDNIKISEHSIIENFSNEDFFDNQDDDQFDVGSGIRSSDTSRFSNSNVWPLLTSFHYQERNKFKKCTTRTKEPGNCMPIQLCPTPNFQLTLEDLIKQICAIDEVFIGICCPEFPAEILKVEWENVKNVSSNREDSVETEECGKIKEESKSWPWMAPLISMSTRKIFCGGVLIKAQYVLTAAHCTRKIPRNQIVVVLGPFGKDETDQEIEVVEIKRHSQYNPRTMQFDIALLKLSRKVSRPTICLPHHEETFVGMKALMLGWRGNFTASRIEEKLLVLPSQECPKGDILCTEPRTEDVMCNVDSGAPLIIKHNEKYEVIGLLTWNRNDCNFPALFTTVSHFKGWIENHSSF